MEQSDMVLLNRTGRIFFDYFLAIQYDDNYIEPDFILYNIKGELVPNVPTFKTIQQFNGGHLLLDGHIIYSINGGLIDLPYDYVRDFEEGYAIVINRIEKERENRYGDCQGEESEQIAQHSDSTIRTGASPKIQAISISWDRLAHSFHTLYIIYRYVVSR